MSSSLFRLLAAMWTILRLYMCLPHMAIWRVGINIFTFPTAVIVSHMIPEHFHVIIRRIWRFSFNFAESFSWKISPFKENNPNASAKQDDNTSPHKQIYSKGQIALLHGFMHKESISWAEKQKKSKTEILERITTLWFYVMCGKARNPITIPIHIHTQWIAAFRYSINYYWMVVDHCSYIIQIHQNENPYLYTVCST